MKPLHLAANQPPDRFYAGGERIAEFRGLPTPPPTPVPHTPEDWVASTTTVFGSADVGLSALPGGQLLRDAVAEAPELWLGSERVAARGTDLILIKLLDAGERLPVHIHPDVPFAQTHLGLNHGKTEGWIALRDGEAHIAFSRDISEEELRHWVDTQDTDAILGAMHRVPLRTGDAVYLPAGLPHAIGAGNFVVELQEPTDLSILLEWRGYPIDGERDGHVGLGFDVALQAVDRRGRTRDEVMALIGPSGPDGDLFPDGAEFFRAHRVRSGATWEAQFAVAIVVAGSGSLLTDDDTTALSAGDTVLVPFAAGSSRLEGDDALDVVLCRLPVS